MQPVTTSASTWGEVSRRIGERDELTKLVSALHRYEGEQLLLASIPYGESIISKGVFNWDLLDDGEEMKSAYGNISIPLSIVVSKTIELHGQVPGETHRNIPLSLLPQGTFVGLFENFASGGLQSALSASAGATTLLVLPPVGNRGDVMRLAKKLGWVCPENIRAGIKMSAESALSFGKFFAHLLDAARSSWRLELAIFPRSFIDLVLEDCEASRALLELSIAQMAIAHARAEATLEMVAQHQRTDQADLLAVRQIAHGYRPGFVPVYGTERDEQILPAADLHKQLYDNSCRLFEIQMENKKGSRPRGADFYPAIFRPSLADERSFYFFKRSFGPHADVPAPQRAENVLSDVRSHVPLEMRFYEKAFDAELQQMLRQDHCPADASPGLDVRLGLSQFIQAGAIRVTPINFGGATRG